MLESHIFPDLLTVFAWQNLNADLVSVAVQDILLIFMPRDKQLVLIEVWDMP